MSKAMREEIPDRQTTRALASLLVLSSEGSSEDRSGPHCSSKIGGKIWGRREGNGEHTGHGAQLMECLPAMHKTLGSVPNTELTRSGGTCQHSGGRSRRLRSSRSSLAIK